MNVRSMKPISVNSNGGSATGGSATGGSASSQVSNSGNANVDVQINVDINSIAYAIACYLHTTKQMNDQEFHHFLTNFKTLSHSKSRSIPSIVSNTLLNNRDHINSDVFSKIVMSRFIGNDTDNVKLFFRK